MAHMRCEGDGKGSEAPSFASLACLTCSMTFESKKKLEEHQFLRGHHRCNICTQNFHDPAALNRHFLQDHDQVRERELADLECPGCSKKFENGSRLMKHIEDMQCSVIKPGHLAARRQKVVDFHEALLKLNDVSENGWGPQMPNDGAAPYAQADNKLAKDSAIYVRNEDFPQWDEQHLALTANPGSDAATGMDGFGRVIDPEKPGFDAGVFYNHILMKYKCPHKFCSSKFPTAHGLAAHLNSTIHKPVAKIQCPCCRGGAFSSMTAAIAHCETFSVRCGIRREGNVLNNFVHQVAGGLFDVKYYEAAENPDTTVRLVVSREFIDSWSGDSVAEEEAAPKQARV